MTFPAPWAKPEAGPLRSQRVDGPRFFSPAEAKATLPRLRPLLAELREGFDAYRFAKAQVDELTTVHRVPDDDPELASWRAKHDEAHAKTAALVRAIGELGADVKDPLLGLVDFYHQRKDGSIVLLCYRDDEADLAHWHTLESGFAGRRPLAEL